MRLMIFIMVVWSGLCKLTTYQLLNALMSFGPTQRGPARPYFSEKLNVVCCEYYGQHQKEYNTICEICAPLFDKKSRCTFMVLCGKQQDTELRQFFGQTCRNFCQTHRNSANTQQFGERATFSRQKVPQFTRRRTAARTSKCGAFGVRKAAHMPPCFQVPLWRTPRQHQRGANIERYSVDQCPKLLTGQEHRKQCAPSSLCK